MSQKKTMVVALIGMVLIIAACSSPVHSNTAGGPIGSNLVVNASESKIAASLPTGNFAPVLASIRSAPMAKVATGVSLHAVDQDTNCRSGPGPGYEILSGLFVKDNSTPILGKYDLGGWWFVQNPQNNGDNCWAWTTTTAADGDVTAVAEQPAPPFIKLVVYDTTYSGSCSTAHQMEAHAIIHSEQEVNVTFHFEADGHPNSPDFSINAISDGSYAMQYNYNFDKSTAGKVRVVMTTPVNFTSNAVEFAVTCTP